MNFILKLLVAIFSFSTVAASCFPAFADKNGDPDLLGFNVFCTSNLDSTGACVNLKNQQPLDCLIIPGQLIDCRSSLGAKFQCVLYSQVTATQAEFFCNSQAELINQEEVIDGDSFSDTLKSP